MVVNQLKDYALSHNLQFFSNKEEIATQMQCGVEDLPQGVTAAAFEANEFDMRTIAFVADDHLYRFGEESRGEDPGCRVEITIEDLQKK